MAKKKFPKYYYPAPDDNMWNTECEKLAPYIFGDCLDLGCGGRTFNPDFKRLDLDPHWEPDILASADDTKLPDESYDFISAIHVFEHLPDQVKALKDWLRILRPGGYIGIVHPDVEFTGIQKPAEDNEMLAAHELYKHEKEQTYADFVKWIQKKTGLGFEIIDHGVAMGHWSFYCILRKKK